MAFRLLDTEVTVYNEACFLVAMTGVNNLTPYHWVKSLPLIWTPGTRR